MDNKKPNASQHFRTPHESHLAVSLVKLVLPLFLRWRYGHVSLQIVGDGLSRFKQLGVERTVICPNHSSHADGDMIFTFSKLVGEEFNMMMARQIFTGDPRHINWLQYLGCYSVMRDAPDIRSFKMTRDLIVEGKRKLVIFPEGELSYDNNTLLPLKHGVARLGFAALEELSSWHELSSIFLLPIAMKYKFEGDVRDGLEKSLHMLAGHLKLRFSDKETQLLKVQRVSEAYLSKLEHIYGCVHNAKLIQRERALKIRSKILERVAQLLAVDLSDHHDEIEAVHILQNALYAVRWGERKLPIMDHKMGSHRRWIKSIYKELRRVLNLKAIYDAPDKYPATQERAAEILDLLEEDNLGHRLKKGSLRVLIDVGQPINLLNHYEDYQANKSATMDFITDKLKEELEEMLSSLNLAYPPVYI